MVEIYKEITGSLGGYFTFLSLLLVMLLWIMTLVKSVFRSYIEDVVKRRHMADPVIQHYIQNMMEKENDAENNNVDEKE